MAQTPVGDLVVNLDVDSTKFNEQLNYVKRQLRQTSDTAGDTTRQVQQSFSKQEAAARRAGISMGQYNAAMRTLPAQFTDIATQLAGGQSPFMILLQQGGQVKDSFGGLAPMFQALRDVLFGFNNDVADSSDDASSSLGDTAEGLNNTAEAGEKLRHVRGFITPVSLGVTALAAATAILAYAWYKGSLELDEYNKQLILTGGYTGKTASNLSDLARHVGESTGEIGKAAAALAAAVGTGNIRGNMLEYVATAAIAMEKATGQSVEKTVAEFSKLADAPVASVLALNKQYHFLTAAVYEQIYALQKQGDASGAAKLAMESYSDAMSSRSSRIEENLGTIERLWNNIKDTASGAWDAMLNIGRQITPAQTLEGLKKQLAEQKSSLASLTAASPNQSDTGYGQQRNRLWAIEQQKKVSATEAQISALEKAIALEGDIAVVREKTATANQEDLDASVRKNTNIERYESNAVKRARELKDLAKDRSKYTAAEYKMVKEGIEKRYADPKTHDKPVKTSAGDREVDSGSAQTLELEAQLRTLRQHKDINDKISPQRRALWELESKIAVLEKIQLDPRGRALTADEKSLLATKEKARAQAEVNARLGDQVLAQQRLNALADQALKFSQQQAAKRSEISAQAEGLSRREAEREANLQRLRDSYAANPQALRSVLIDQQATYDAEDALRSDWLAGAKQGWAEYKDSATNVFSSVQQVSQSTFSGLANQLTTLTTTGKASFKDFTTSILKMIASVTNQLIVAYTLQSAMGWISGSTQTPATGQSLAVPSFRPPGYDGGGFTGHGGKYDPAGIVHRGEFVFHKEATSRLGVGNLYRLMRGYASGGFVGGSASPAGVSPFGVSVYAPVSVTTQQDNAQPKGNNDQLGRAYQQVIDKAVRDGITRESRPGGILWGITKPR